MKILHVSDLHLRHDWFDWISSHCSEWDLLVIAGDLQSAWASKSVHEQARSISRWLIDLKTPVVVCTGNHDTWRRDPRVSVDTSAEGGWLKNLRNKGNVVGVDGDTFSFQGICNNDEWLKFAVNGWLKVPYICGHVDVVVTHAPPTGCACAGGAEGRDVGDPELWPALEDYPPTILLCGHVHAPTKYACVWPPIDPTTLILVPGCDEQAPTPAHWIIDTDIKVATHSSGEIVQWEPPRRSD